MVRRSLAVGSWMNLLIPTINVGITKWQWLVLLRVSLLFQYSDATIWNVHICYGNEKIPEINELALEGIFLTKGFRNTFNLNKVHIVKSGISVSFQFLVSMGKTLVKRGLKISILASYLFIPLKTITSL
jgi:hypothetical protein